MARKKNTLPTSMTEGHRRFVAWIEGVNRAEIARQLGITRQTMTEIAAGRMRPALDLAYGIEQLTGGAVKTAAWVQPARPLTIKAA